MRNRLKKWCRRGRILSLGLLVAVLCLPAPLARAEVPEPDKILFGTITHNGKGITEFDGYRHYNVTSYVVEAWATATGGVISSYAMGSDTNYHPYFYGIKVTLEAYPAKIDADNLIGDTIYLVLRHAGIKLMQSPFMVTNRGLSRFDFGPAADSDGDGIPDLDEIDAYKTDPFATDSDGDGLNDGYEIGIYHTDPLKPDTDADGQNDGFEVMMGSDPTSPASFLASISGNIAYAGVQPVGRFHIAASAWPGQALALDGQNGYVAVTGLTYDAAGVVSALTVAAWVQTTSRVQNIVVSWGRRKAWRLAVGGRYDGRVGFDTTDATGTTDDMEGRTPVNDGRWHYIAATFNASSGTKRIYVDGILDLVRSNAHVAGYGLVRAGGAAGGALGAEPALAGGYFNGRLDEVSIWQRVLTAEEIKTRLSHQPSPLSPGLAAWWSFNAGDASDQGLHGYHGALIGGAATVPGVPSVAAAGLSQCRFETHQTDPGAYTITNIPTLKDYCVYAFRDANSNGAMDRWEAQGVYFDNPIEVTNDTGGINVVLTDPDSDGDGLLDYQEIFVYGTDPDLADTDHDSLSDDREINVTGTDPKNPDSDNDGLTDAQELNFYHTNPNKPDSDGDGFNDLVEILHHTDPLDPLDRLHVVNDYNRDARSDLAVFLSQNANWFIWRSTTGAPSLTTIAWGWADATPVPGDYDGDGGADLAVYSQSAGKWYIRTISGAVLAWDVAWGFAEAMPVPGDYDGDGKDDLAVYNENTGKWYIRSLAKNQTIAWNLAWGWPGAKPVSGDYDGDGRSDLAVLDGNGKRWFIYSIAKKNNIAWNVAWGWAGCAYIPGDFDGDGRSDLAVYDQATQLWYVYSLATGKAIAWKLKWGFAGGIPVSGDYDGDGKTDFAMYDQAAGKWYIRNLAGVTLMWGQAAGGSTAAPVKP